jgi:hypothetical protein
LHAGDGREPLFALAISAFWFTNPSAIGGWRVRLWFSSRIAPCVRHFLSISGCQNVVKPAASGMDENSGITPHLCWQESDHSVRLNPWKYGHQAPFAAFGNVIAKSLDCIRNSRIAVDMEESCSKAEIGGLKFKITGPLIEMNQFLSAIGNGQAGNRAFPWQHLPLANGRTLHNSPCDQQAVHSFFDDL